MAFCSTRTCTRCGDEYMASQYNDVMQLELICHKCRRADWEQEREKHLDDLAALSIDKRIRKIEEWIYDHENPYDVVTLNPWEPIK